MHQHSEPAPEKLKIKQNRVVSDYPVGGNFKLATLLMGATLMVRLLECQGEIPEPSNKMHDLD